jgi:hypothetical protein
MLKVEPIVREPCSFEVEVAVKKLKIYTRV